MDGAVPSPGTIMKKYYVTTKLNGRLFYVRDNTRDLYWLSTIPSLAGRQDKYTLARAEFIIANYKKLTWSDSWSLVGNINVNVVKSGNVRNLQLNVSTMPEKRYKYYTGDGYYIVDEKSGLSVRHIHSEYTELREGRPKTFSCGSAQQFIDDCKRFPEARSENKILDKPAWQIKKL